MPTLFHHKYPLAFSSTILCMGMFNEFGPAECIAISIIAFSVYLIVPFLRRELVLGICVFLLASWVGKTEKKSFFQEWYKTSKDSIFIGEVTYIDIEKRRCRVDLKARENLSGHWTFYPRSYRAEFPIEPNKVPLCGDRLLVHGKMSSPPAITQDGGLAFDASKYYLGETSFGRIFHAQYTRLSTSKSLHHQWQNQLQRWRVYTLKQVKRVLSPLLFQFYRAVFFGDKKSVSQPLKSLFAKAGLMHVLSVSGMHVGLVYLFVFFPFKMLGRLYRHIMKIEILVLPFIWGYALVAGMAEPAIRASLLISILVISRVFLGRSIRLEDAIFSTFLISVLWNPLRIYSLSFQLSYAAMLGIAFLLPLWRRRFEFPNKLIQGLADLTGVSICCTLTTMPLVLLYFHKLPIAFLFGNLIFSLPFTLIMFGFMLVTFFVWVPVLAAVKWLSFLLEGIYRISISALEVIDRFDPAFVYAMNMDAIQFVFMATLIWGIYRWYRFEHKKYLLYLLIGMNLLLVLNLFGYITHVVHAELNTYELKNETPTYILKAQSLRADTLFLRLTP